MSISSSKVKLRKSLLKQRLSLSPKTWQQKSQQICHNLASLSNFQQAKTILAYFSFRQEPDLSSLFTNNNYQWGFPRCIDNALCWHLWQPKQSLETNNYGINEPLSEAKIVDVKTVDLILVPAVACDYQGYRLGYGGGYYDRLLSFSLWSSIPTIGIIFDFAYLPTLPIEPWDTKLTIICTEKQVFQV